MRLAMALLEVIGVEKILLQEDIFILMVCFGYIITILRTVHPDMRFT